MHNHSQKHFILGFCLLSSLYFIPYSLRNKLRNIQPNRWLEDHRMGEGARIFARLVYLNVFARARQYLTNRIEITFFGELRNGLRMVDLRI